jgi:multiple sugar transport system permease protein
MGKLLKEKMKKKAPLNQTGEYIGTYIFLVLGAVIMLIPFMWMFLTAFKTYPEAVRIPVVWFPQTWNFKNFKTVLESLDFIRYYQNTIIVTVIVVSAQLLMCSLSAYTFARMNFPFKNILFFLLLMVFMVPPQMTLIPKYLLVAKLGWIDTLRGIIVPGVFSVYTVFMLRQFFQSLPRELEDAARIDGCSYFRIYWSIMLPLITNGIVAIGMLNILWAWNEVLWPLIVSGSDKTRVLSVAIATLQGGRQGAQYHLMMAASTLTMAPMIILYLICQRFFIVSISQTGIKG